MKRAYSQFEIKSVDEEKRIIEGIATTPQTDRDGDIVDPMGGVYKTPLPFLYQHGRDAFVGRTPVGNVIAATPTPTGIPVRIQMEKSDQPGRLKEILDFVWQAIQKKLVRGLSIGFAPIEAADIQGTWGQHFTKWEWVELSAVSIPANVDATITTIKSYDDAALAAPGTGAPPSPPPRAVGKPVYLKPQSKAKGNMKPTAERIAAFEAQRASKVAQLNAIAEKCDTEGRTKDAAEREEFDTVTAEIASIDQELKDLRALEKLNVESVKPVAGKTAAEGSEARGTTVIVKGEIKLPPGVRMARVVKAMGMAHRKHRDVEAVAKEMYPDDALVHKAAVAAGTTVSGNWAAGLVGEEGAVFADFVEFLRPQTILGKFGQNGIPALRQTDFYAPIVTQTAGGAGYWVGEGKAKPLTKFAFERRTLTPLKVANIAVLSEENIRFSSPKSDLIVRDSLVAALRERMDIDFINPDKAAVAGISPASITNGITPIPSSGTDADALRADIGALLAAFIADNNPPSSAVVIMPATLALTASLMRNALGQREFPDISMNGGFIEGLPVIVSENVTSDDYGAIVVVVNASDIHLADDGGFQVDTSREASLEMDDAPSHNSGTPTPAQLVSMFQTNSVAIRAERIINWARRRESSVQFLRDVLWAV